MPKNKKHALTNMNKHSLLSSKPVSISHDENNILFGVDRIEGWINRSIGFSANTMKNRFIKGKHYDNYGYVRTYNVNNSPFYLLFWNQYTDQPRGFYFNPNNVHCINSYLRELETLMPFIFETQVTRADFNADFQMSFEDVIKTTQILYKQKYGTYDLSNNKSGYWVGSGNEIIRTYQKTPSYNARQVTRIESQLRGTKLPKEKSLLDILKWIPQSKQFSNVTLWSVDNSFTAEKLNDISLVDGLNKHSSLVNYSAIGFNYAKKKHSVPGNFIRDIRSYVNIKRSNISLTELFTKQMTNRFEV